MSKRNKPKTISDRTWQGRQSWNREVIETLGDERVRFTIKCDAYDFQSFAKAEVWRADGWRQIHHIPGQAVRIRVSYVVNDVAPSVFDPDLAELRRVASGVLGAP